MSNELPVGTKSKRSDGVWKKVQPGVWQKISDPKGKSHSSSTSGKDDKHSAEIEKADNALKAVAAKYPHYKLPPSGETPKVGQLAPILPGKPWKMLPKAAEDSLSKHRGSDGDWTPERKKLHKAIFAHFLGSTPSVPEGKQPTVVMMMGGPATGKGALTGAIPSDQYMKVDADSIKEMLPEYQELIKKGDKGAASYVHAESSELASRLREKGRKYRKNMVLDGTGRNAMSYGKHMQSMKAEGYHVQLMMPVVDDVEKIVERAKQRGKETGRWVPEKFIREHHQPIMHNFESLAKEADSAFLFNNNGDKPQLAWSKFGDHEQAVDPEFHAAFRAKYGKKSKERPESKMFASLKSLIEDEGPVVSPQDLVTSILKAQKPRRKFDERFSPDEGIIVPVDNDL